MFSEFERDKCLLHEHSWDKYVLCMGKSAISDLFFEFFYFPFICQINKENKKSRKIDPIWHERPPANSFNATPNNNKNSDNIDHIIWSLSSCGCRFAKAFCRRCRFQNALSIYHCTMHLKYGIYQHSFSQSDCVYDQHHAIITTYLMRANIIETINFDKSIYLNHLSSYWNHSSISIRFVKNV